MSTAFDFDAITLEGNPISLRQHAGKVLLIVNTASRCGFTPQYGGLQQLHQRFQARGFEVLGFPCNQFGAQEPGDEAEIGAFCERNYGVAFPMFAKVEVNGAQAHPLWKWLRSEATGLLGSEAIKWNFTKFLVRRDGSVFKRYAPQASPESIAEDIEVLLAESGS